ncbi:sensor domain-containing diguanylate cyclase [Pseudomonas typographi]|uniref:sensor domain-containing diguanylate cyclase n=1 Tax=Pseudomonas typographi TaxID=2715964 RepID=UPI0016890B44|nr:sensor domain-containing diguanylate cyclase [Pseudomonas typographi]MBD1555098.1 GGDEF domain-containing protein [Pseudomonas typographi]
MNKPIELTELHWLLAITQSIDVGVMVFDLDYQVRVWNTFMENRSGVAPADARARSFFELFPEVDRRWFSSRVENVVTLGTPSFTIWEQRPYLVRFDNYQPITGQEAFMYQNTTLFPLRSTNNQVEHLCLVIYDVTDVAVNRRQLLLANEELQKLSSTDRLTGLYNRGHWEEALKLEYARHARYGNMSSLIMFDIDHFKKVNDTYGHPTGDKVIQSVANVVREHVRDADIYGRYGGEEFALLLPDTDKAGGLVLAERLRHAVEGMAVSHGGNAVNFTISLGVADLSRPAVDYKELIEWADQALYVSKKSGRNRVTVHG